MRAERDYRVDWASTWSCSLAVSIEIIESCAIVLGRDKRKTDFMILRGRVRAGKGDFSYWIGKLHDHYIKKTGMKLYAGTLNVHLIGRRYELPQNCIRLEKEEYGGTVSVSLAPCKIFDRIAFILRTDSDDGKHGDPPETILEIATDVRLRDEYNLRDGDVVEVEVPDHPDNTQH